MNNKLQREISLEVSDLHIREANEGESRRTVEGYAVVFGVRSTNLTPWSSEREVYEVMEPGCIDEELLSRSDVVLTAFHDNKLILGRWREGKGTLYLGIDDHGMSVRCTLGQTAVADQILSGIERGDISGMSFAFTSEEDDENSVTYEKTRELTPGGKAVWLRHVKRVKNLYDVTIAGHPAYPQTDIAAREEVDAFFDSKLIEPESEEQRNAREAEELAKQQEEQRRKAEALRRRSLRRELEERFR